VAACDTDHPMRQRWSLRGVHVTRDASSGGGSDIAGPPGGDETGAWSQRIVRGPRRPTRVLVAVAVVGLAVGAVVFVWPDAGTPPAGEGGDEGKHPTTNPADGSPATSAPAAFRAAVQRFGRVHTFDYSGTVHSAGPGPLRPGPWLANEQVVQGAVYFPRLSMSPSGSHTWEVATATSDTFAITETVTFGSEVWSRTAAPSQPGPPRIGTSAEAASTLLAGVPWAVVPAPTSGIVGPDPAVPTRLGLALLPDALESASAARDEAPDHSGRRVIRATIPEPVAGVPGTGGLFAGADVVVTLDRSGDVARVVLTLPPEGDPTLIVNVEISLG
jgi:hypothetical protein